MPLHWVVLLNELTEISFIGGMSSLGVISLFAGFIENKILIIVVRALSGIGEHSRCYVYSDS